MMSADQNTHAVKSGDTLWGISHHYDVNIDQLARLNNLHGKRRHMLQIGQLIKLPTDADSIDTELSLRILDLAFRPIKRAKLRLEFDGKQVELAANELGEVGPINIHDHAKGLKVHFCGLDGNYGLIADHETLPIGRKRLTLTSRRMVVRGKYWAEQGTQRKASGDVRREIKSAHADPHINPGDGQPTAPGQKAGQASRPGRTASSSSNGATKPRTQGASSTAKAEPGIWTRIANAVGDGFDWLTGDGEASISAPSIPVKPAPRPVITQTRVEDGKPQHAIGAVFAEANLYLTPANEKYRKLLISIAEKHGLTPHALAALINAEASKLDNGEWNANAKAGSSSAAGLTQFLNLTWLQVATDRRSAVNQKLKADYGYEQVNGKWDGDVYSIHGKTGKSKTPIKSQLILPWRYIPEYAIDAAAVYGLVNMESLKEKGLDARRLAPEDLAKVMYLAHHEGAAGAIKVIRGTLDDDKAKELLPVQVGDEKAVELFKRFKGDYDKAYTHWLYSYIDAKINVVAYMVKPEGLRPRSMVEIAAVLQGAQPPKPEPKAAPKPSAPMAVEVSTAKTDEAKLSKPVTSITGGVGGAVGWHDPLRVNTIRTAGLASARSATFGKVRNNNTRNHQGVDLAANAGTNIYAVANGKVVNVAKGFKTTAGYGATLVLSVDVKDLPDKQRKEYEAAQPGNDQIYFFYAHLSRIDVALNKDGVCFVEAGKVLGATGDSGNASGMNTIAKGGHLHFEVRHKKDGLGKGLVGRLDPLPYLAHYTMPKK